MIQGNPQKETKRRISKNIIPFFRQDALTDLQEIYEELVQEKGFLRAIVWYVIQLLKFIRGRIINKLYWSISMFKNYVKIVLRNIQRHKGYSFINIAGLALGIACCILLLAYINFELSYDKYHERADRIFRLTAKGSMADEVYTNARMPAGLIPFLKSDYPEIEETVRFASDIFNMFRYEDKTFYEPNFFYADPSVFSIFTFPLIRGNSKTALQAPNTMVLSQELAVKYFGHDDPIGKVLRFNDEIDLTVTGVLKNIPANTHLKFDILLSWGTYEKSAPWGAQSKTTHNCYAYLLLKEGVDQKTFALKCADCLDRHITDHLKSIGAKLKCIPQLIKSIHLHSNLQNDNPGHSSIVTVYLLMSITLLMLLTACINYVSLTSVRKMIRVREVGMRKVLGAGRKQIIGQFLGESICYTVIAFLLGIVFVIVAIPSYNQLTGLDLDIHSFFSTVWLVELTAILIIVSLLSGIYPALMISGINPIRSMKGLFQAGKGQLRIRSAFVVFQFIIMVTLIIITAGIYNQLQYVSNSDLGFSKDQLLNIKFHNDHSDNDNRINWINALKAELVQLDGVVAATLSNHVPGTNYYQRQYVPEGFPENQTVTMESYCIDADFLNTLNIPVVKGRGFSNQFSSDAERTIMINEVAARQIGWENPIGKRLTYRYRYNGNLHETHYSVIGVIKDFHSQSLHHPIMPQIIQNLEDFHTLSLRLKPENLEHTMTAIQNKWKEFEPHHPFDYFFLDHTISQLYRKERQVGKVIRIFTFLAAFIGCLGLFGLVSFLSQRRIKEIGVRKSMGASSKDIVALLTKGFLKWIALANLFAWPLGYAILNQWLQNYAYRTSIGWRLFVLSGSISILIALTTIGYRVIKAARSNPVDALRYE